MSSPAPLPSSHRGPGVVVRWLLAAPLLLLGGPGVILTAHTVDSVVRNQATDASFGAFSSALDPRSVLNDGLVLFTGCGFGSWSRSWCSWSTFTGRVCGA